MEPFVSVTAGICRNFSRIVVFPEVMKTNSRHQSLSTLLAIVLLGVPPVALKAQSVPEAGVGQSYPAGKRNHYGKLLASLTPTERQQLKAAMKSIKNDPRLVAASQAVKDAGSVEARQAARKAKLQIRRELLLKADPTLQPIIEKGKASRLSKDKSIGQ